MAWRWAVGMLACVALSCEIEPGSPSPCQAPAACEQGACVASKLEEIADLERLPLQCGATGTGASAGEACERGADCRSGICALAGACVEPCEDADDCAARERCQLVYARGSRARLHPLEACVAMIDLPADAEIRVETLEAAFDGGVSELALPPTAANTLFVIEHLDDSTWPVPAAHTDCRPAVCARQLGSNDAPDETWFDRQQLTAASGPINPITVGEHVHPLGVLVPSGPRAVGSTAGYTLTVETKIAGRARLTSLSRAPRSGQLDLNLYYVGSNLKADVVEDALAEVDRIFEPAEIFIGELRHIAVTGALPERGSELPNAEVSRGFAELELQYGVYPQLPELFKLSAGAGNTALDVFLVARIAAAQGGSVGGLAGGTPVPFGMHGTGASGLAIATDPWVDDPERLGRTLAHELGHALGLFHTVERNGQVFDPLPDTPACDVGRDRDDDGLDASDCEGAGADNLMFPTANATASQLTPDQAAVLRAAMILR